MRMRKRKKPTKVNFFSLWVNYFKDEDEMDSFPKILGFMEESETKEESKIEENDTIQVYDYCKSFK